MLNRFANTLCLTAFVGLVSLFLLPSLADAAGRTAVQVGVRHEGNVHVPQLSPDGRKIAYEVNIPAENRTELWIVGWENGRVSGKAEKLVPESMSSSRRYGGGKRIAHSFSWASQGQHAYAYSVTDSTGAQDIYVDNWSTMVESSGSANKNASWDPNEPRFVFSSGRSGNGDLYLWDDGKETPLTYDDDNAELYPTFHPQGAKVAYVRQGKAGSHIFVLDMNTFASTPLVQYEGKESTRPCFSPDGGKVSFFSNKATSSPTKFGLWVTDARAGGAPRNIAAEALLPSKGCASWTPDGKGVVAVKDSPDEGDPVCIFPVDGGTPNCLTSAGTRNNRDPQLVEVDGQWRVVFTAQVSGGDKEATWQEIYVYDIPR